MSVTYRPVGWNRQKNLYDWTLVGGIGLYLAVFIGAGLLLRPGTTIETLLIRALGTGALLLLHVVLSIGPLARLDRRFLPLLYNRRHLGVVTFGLGLLHGGFSLVQFHALGNVNPLVSLLTASSPIERLADVPFQPLGLAALTILFLMAATSHDFWLKQLTAPQWKRLHMAAYLAYGLLIAHVALGVLQAETHPALTLLLVLGFLWLVSIHGLSGWRERALDRQPDALDDTVDDKDWVDVGGVDDFEPGRAKVLCATGERVAIFRDGDRLSALSNVCQHQNGPLGEGRIVNGCAVCPWHGYEYRLASGSSPAPFTEKVPTFNLRVADGRVFLDPRPNAAGTAVEPVLVGAAENPQPADFYIGYQASAPPSISRHLQRTVAALMVLAVSVALVAAASQRPFAVADFEYGNVGKFEGRLSTAPYPALQSSAATDEPPRLLVAFGKRGADALVAGLDGRRVEIEGQRILRGPTVMIELTDEPVAGSTGPGPAAIGESLGEQTLKGEIVDSKCHLGVMKPGDGKPHRACAVRCISGGAPPMLWVRSASGEEAHYLLVGRDDRQLGAELLDRVAEPIQLTGELVKIAGLWTVRTEPSEISRLAGDRAPGAQ